MSKKYSEFLGSAKLSGARLNMMHAFTKDIFEGRLVDSSIPLDRPDLVVADVCAGTGIWLAQLSEQLPSTCSLEGLDLNLDQQPPSAWLSPNVSFKKFDIFASLHADLVERYDVINVQYAMTFVSDDTFPSVLERLVKMLKPGGYIQWTDSDWIRRRIVQSNTDRKAEDTVMYKVLVKVYELMGVAPPRWTSNIASGFDSIGLEDVKFIGPAVRSSTVQSVTQSLLIGVAEVCEVVPSLLPAKKAEAEELKELCMLAWQEFQNDGVGGDMRCVRCVGRKRSNGQVLRSKL